MFSPLEFEHKSLFDDYLLKYRRENSHANFTNFYMWRKMFNIKWREENGILFVIAGYDGKTSACEPICDAAQLDEAIAAQIADFQKLGAPLVVSGIEKPAAEIYGAYGGGDYFSLEPDREDFDYVYDAERLAALTGKHYHKKKNHLNAFLRDNPDAEYRPITDELIPLCKKELDAWYALRRAEYPDDPYLAPERAAIYEVFTHYRAFGLTGGAVLIGGRVVAFSFGEKLNADTAVVHVEKADPNLRGAFVSINSNFVRQITAVDPSIKFINRQEDMGHEGLRKAKESWHPVKMIEKFVATMKTVD